MTSRALYFAYGSNLVVQQLEERCPEAVLVATGTLHGHRLDFAGWSPSWQGGVATVNASHQSNGVVGALWSVSHDDLANLDKYEGCPSFYKRILVEVAGDDNFGNVYANTYVLNRLLTAPSMKYLEAISDGRRGLGLPDGDLLDAAVRADRSEKKRRAEQLAVETLWRKRPPPRTTRMGDVDFREPRDSYSGRTSDSPRKDPWAPSTVVRKRRPQ